MSDLIRYEASPTASLFHMSDARMRFIMGPIGSGKSVACCMEILIKAQAQKPDRQGRRRSKWAIIRNTYPELENTTIKTWQEWIHPSLCKLKWSKPITGEMVFDHLSGDGTRVEAELIFLSLDKPEDTKKLLSLDLTGAWFNEVRELDKAFLNATRGRMPRYPPEKDGGPSWFGIIADTNPSSTRHWFYELAELEKPEGHAFFKQPSAMYMVSPDTPNSYPGPAGSRWAINPLAENVKHLTGGHRYYIDMLPGNDLEFCKVHIGGQYGSIFTGRPVYEHVYNDGMHASDTTLEIYRGLPLYLGTDYGLTPATIVGQISPRGQLRILREYVHDRGGIRQFMTNVVKPALANEFAGMNVVSTGDPAGTQASQVDELTCIGEMCRLGIQTEPARTNEFLARKQAVESFLTRTIDGEPGFLLDPSCKMLREGFLGGYQFARVQSSGTGERKFREQPEKNSYSHPHDALQYLAMRGEEGGVTSFDTRAHVEPEPEASQRWKAAV